MKRSDPGKRNHSAEIERLEQIVVEERRRRIVAELLLSQTLSALRRGDTDLGAVRTHIESMIETIGMHLQGDDRWTTDR